MVTRTTQLTGAWASVCYCDGTEPMEVYISFGDYNEATNRDNFGVSDNRIFFYATGESELVEMMKERDGDDFVVLKYALCYLNLLEPSKERDWR